MDNICFKNIKDPFIIESRIISFQLYLKKKALITKNMFIIKNICKVVNFNDPITLELLYDGKFHYNLDYIYPIFRKKKLYIYKLSSINEIILNNSKEIFTNTLINKIEIKNINKINKILNYNFKNEYKYNKLNKINTFLKNLDYIGTYFSIKDYELIKKNQFISIYRELKTMWSVFKNDNQLSEMKLFKKKIIWRFKCDDYENELLDICNLLLSIKSNKLLLNMISYVIIGSFSYVCPHIKKIFSNIVFD